MPQAAGSGTIGPRTWIFLVGLAAFVLPTLFDVARVSWSTEQGAHGPIVLMTGLWLLQLELRKAPVAMRPGNGWIGWPLFAVWLVVGCLTRITGIIEIEGFSMYFATLSVIYLIWGSAVLQRIWFPLIYLAFIFPPPDTLFAMITQPLKIVISGSAVHILQMLDYPAASSGVMIRVGQYQMLVAAACAGLNSLISLTALGLFYTYVRRSSNPLYMAVLVLFIFPVAVLANLVRVLLLMLITYHFGEAAGQGFFHELAGLSMFATALLTIFGIDMAASSLLGRYRRGRGTP